MNYLTATNRKKQLLDEHNRTFGRNMWWVQSKNRQKKAKIKCCLEIFLGGENTNFMWKEKSAPHLPASHQGDCLLNKCVTEMDECVCVTCLFHVLHAAGGQVHTVTYKDATWQALMVFMLCGEAESGARLQRGTAVIFLLTHWLFPLPELFIG